MFFSGYSILTFAGFIILVGALILLNELTRHSKILSVAIYIVFPLLMTLFVWPRLAGGNVGGTWFAWVKTYSALAGVLIFMAIRYSDKLAKNKIMLFLPAAILALNIAEAVLADLQCAGKKGEMVAGLLMKGGVWNYLNAAAGILLILTLTGTFGIKIAKTPSRDMIWPDMGWGWIIAYDLWNLSYCYNCISNRSFYAGMALLLACTTAEFVICRGAWLQHRAQTLALFAMFSLTVDYSSNPLFQIRSTHEDLPKIILAAAALLANLAVMIYQIQTMRRTRRNPLKDDLYVDTKFYQANLKANRLSTQ